MRQHRLYVFMCLLLFTKLLPAFQEVPLNLLSEKESVDLLLSMGKVETITDGALAAAKKIAKAANYLRTCQAYEQQCTFVSLFCSSSVFVDPWWSRRPGKE